MAVAVANPHLGAQMPAVHVQEAQDALLDALLSSCEKPKNLPLKSFGRELKPYFHAADPTPLKPATSQKPAHRKNSPQPVAAAAAAAAASTKQINANTPNHGSKKGAAARSKNSPPRKRNAPTSAVNPTGSPTTTAAPLVPFNSGEMAAFLSWAGPGFCVAPTPDSLPLPSTTLLE